MDRPDHLITFVIGNIIVFLLRWLYSQQWNWYLLYSIIIYGFLINPDWFEPKEYHRWFLGHSMLFPLILYFATRPYLDIYMGDEYALILFLPLIWHLCADLGGVQGYGLIKIGKWNDHLISLDVKQSYAWILGNIGIMIGLLVWWNV
jgi:hypothetical protein